MNSDKGFRGNKSYLPSKPCLSCAKPMVWRKSWAKNWAEVRYCCSSCKRKGASSS